MPVLSLGVDPEVSNLRIDWSNERCNIFRTRDSKAEEYVATLSYSEAYDLGILLIEGPKNAS